MVATDPLPDLGWALGTLTRAYLKQVQAVSMDLPGGPRAYQVMAIAAADSCQNQAEIAERLGIDRTVMTYLVDGLEEAGLVRRTPDPDDRRARRVTLTETGATHLASMGADVARAEARLLAGLSDEDAASLRRIVLLAAQNVEAPDGGVEPCAEVPDAETLDRV